VPTVPAGLSTVPLTNTSVLARWTDNVSNEDEFELQRREYVGGEWSEFAEVQRIPGGGTSYTDATGLVTGRIYQYRIRACNMAGCSGFETAPQFTLSGAPLAPTGVTAQPLSRNSIRVTWTDASMNESGFTIQRRRKTPTGFTAWALVANLPANRSSYDNTVPPSPTYQYRVRACNAAGCSADVESNEVKIPTAVPTAPNGLSATAPSGTTVALVWVDRSTNEASFGIQRRQRNGATWSAWSNLTALPPNTVGYEEGGRTAGTTYQYRVRACNVIGCSGFSTAVSVTP
jgi:predicted phage tail protein